jgi:carbon-monoxide dehydrogenase medium subunit
VQISGPFNYARAESVDHAIQLLEEHGPESRLIAGGHSLLPMMKLRLARPDWLIDINDLHEFEQITEAGDYLRIGALVRHAALLGSETVARLFPIISDAERVIADPVVRNRGTIGGSLCQADPAEDLSTVCQVLQARVVIRGSGGERTLSMAELHRGPYETAVEHDEILTEIQLPIRPRSGSAYEKVERRVGDWAIAAAGAAISLATDGSVDQVGIGLTAVGLDDGTATRAEEAVRGKQPDEDVFAVAARIAAEDCDPLADQRGPVDYKRHLAAELTKRALRRACARASAQVGG